MMNVTVQAAINSTPVIRAGDRLIMKLEHLQPGQSHKARAAGQILLRAELRGDLKPGRGDVVIEKSGGNMGLGLAVAVRGRYSLELLVRPSFSATRRKILGYFGARLIGAKEMEAGLSNAEILEQRISAHRAAGRAVFFPDQFSNLDGVEGHRTGAREFTAQLKALGVQADQPLSVYGGVGTGASLRGYVEGLREAFTDVEAVLVQPEGCDVDDEVFASHPIEGLAVGVRPALYAPELVSRRIHVPAEHARVGQRTLAAAHGQFVGPSTGLIYAAFLHAPPTPGRLAVMITYDGQDAYFSDQLLKDQGS